MMPHIAAKISLLYELFREIVVSPLAHLCLSSMVNIYCILACAQQESQCFSMVLFCPRISNHAFEAVWLNCGFLSLFSSTGLPCGRNVGQQNRALLPALWSTAIASNALRFRFACPKIGAGLVGERETRSHSQDQGGHHDPWGNGEHLPRCHYYFPIRDCSIYTFNVRHIHTYIALSSCS